MNKVAMLIGGAVVLGLVGVPYVTGVIAESETKRLVEQLNQQSELYGSLNIDKYDRGFSSSSVTYQYSVSPSWAAITGFDDSIQYDCVYSHGYTGIDFSCNFMGNPSYRLFVEQHFAGTDPVSITGSISSAGGITQVVKNQEIDHTSDDGVVIKVTPSLLQFESDLEFSRMDSSVEIDTVEIREHDGTFTLTDAEVDLSFTPTSLGLFEGEYKMTIGDLVIEGADASIKMNALTATGDSTERGPKMDSTGKLEVASFAAISPSEKREYFADDISLELAILGLDSKALEEYQTFSRNLQVDLAANAQQGGDATMDPVQLMALVPIVEKMLDKDLTLSLEGSANIFEAPNSLGFNLQLLEKMSFAQLSALAYNPEQVLQNMKVDLTAMLNKELVNSNPSLGALMANSPLILSEGENYQTTIKLGAESSVNGRTVTIAELQGMILGGGYPIPPEK